nr:efflux RND transporter periplasmic adaptor subunit [uncultured Roseateles sp.]
MRKQWLIGGVTAVLVAGGATAFFLTSDQASAKSKKDGDKQSPALEFVGSEVVRPTQASIASVIEFSGPLVAPGTAVVRAKAAGTLLSLNVAEGSRVKAGQVLGQVDLEELRQRVNERSATVESARAQFDQAERQHRANEGLAAQKFIAPTALETSKAAMEAARAQWLSAKAQLEGSNLSVRNAALLAPINGVVSKRHALPGEKVSMEQQVLTIVDLSKLELAGSVGTHEVSRLTPGMAVQVQIEGADAPVEARIARIAPAAEPGTRSIGVTLELANPKELFRAGQYATGKVSISDEASRLTVPIAAIGSTAGQEHVWMIEKGALVRRIVTTGRRDVREGRVEVLQGLTAEAQVLGARFDNLREGAKALIVASKPTVASAATGSSSN